MAKKVIVIGSGGREHALAWKLADSPQVDKVFIAPGNGGTGEIGENVDIKPDEADKLLDFCQQQAIDLAVIGPDDALAAGLADTLREAGIITFGPSKSAAKIEWSKAFSKDLMAAQNVPTAKYQNFTDPNEAINYAKAQAYPLVVKASGLALGKGVIICQNFTEAENAIKHIMLEKAFKNAGETIVIEEFLIGDEVSFHALSDGQKAVMFPPSQDHKQLLNNDKGPNTGGMGVFGPVDWVSPTVISEVKAKAVQPILDGLQAQNTPFAGCLYPGLMITKNGLKVLEYNSRFGDPETQIYMRLLDSDLYDLLVQCATNNLRPETVKWKSSFAVSVVLASGGYPGDYAKGVVIDGVKEAAAKDDIVIFHAGTARQGTRLVTAGGRVLNVTALASTLDEAISKAYQAVAKIHFDGMQYRTDIGKRQRLSV